MIPKKNYLLNIFKLISIVFLLMNCSSDNNNNKIIEKNDLEMYKNALSMSVNGKHKEAALEFDTININYPYSALSVKAEIMAAYSLYQNNENQKAILKLQSFLEMNPSGEFTEYAQYLLAMCYYTQISNKERDPNLLKQAINSFKILISKYPDGKYAKNAKLKIQYINNFLASNELSIGVFYLKKNSPIAAIKRFKFILENYKNTNVIPETLYRLCEGLLMISLKEEAMQSKALLVFNFPQNRWTELSKKLFETNKDTIEDKKMITNLKNYIITIFD